MQNKETSNNSSPKLLLWLFIVILIIGIVEAFSYFKVIDITGKKDAAYFSKPLSFAEAYKKELPQSFNWPDGLEYKKRPIILFGCSYVYGGTLEKNQTLAYRLASLSQRPVYNFSYHGWGPQQMIYLLLNESALDKVKNPEFVIYTFIPDHINRLYSSYNMWLNNFNLTYEYNEKKNTLIQKKPMMPFLYRFYTTRLLTYSLESAKNNDYSDKNINKNFDYLEYIFRASKNLLEKKYPGVKFVILKYPEFENSVYSSSERWKELEKDGFIILDAAAISGSRLYEPEYKTPDGSNPNEKAWESVAPALAKQLNL